MQPTIRKKPDLTVAHGTTEVTNRTESPDNSAEPLVKAATSRTSYSRRFFQLLLPLLVIAGGVATYNYLKATKPEIKPRPPRPQIFNVTSVPVTIANHRPRLRLYGTTVAGRQAEMRALVAGQVLETAPALKEGGLLQAGDPILSIDPFDYRATIDENQAQIAEARAKISEMQASIKVEEANLRYAKEQLKLAERDLARAEPLVRQGAVSQRSVDDRQVVLVQRRQAMAQSENNMRVWQARIAQQDAAIKRLESSLSRARQRLTETKLVAPFNAYVVDVGAQIGRMLSVNDRVATLIDRDWIEVAFTLTDRQFGRMARDPEGVTGRKVEVHWRVGTEPLVFQAVIDRVGAKVSSSAGGVQVYARIEQPAQGVGLRPGAFVEVFVPDTKFEDVARLPSTAVFDNDTVFTINDGKLKSRKVEIVGTAGSDVLVRGDIATGQRVMITRLSTPGDGVRVKETANGG